MQPPEAPNGTEKPAVFACFQILKNRADFLRAARGRRAVMASMLVQGRAREDADPVIRIGFTCSKKVGNAVARNRAKRRLRAAARAILPVEGRAGWDYVLIGKAEATAGREFGDLLGDLRRALQQIHAR